MATKVITAWVNGAVQNIEVEDITSEIMPSIEERLEALEDKPVITDGNFLVGDGTTEPEEITPEDVLDRIGGVNVETITTAEYEELKASGGINANTLYNFSDSDEIVIPSVTEDDEGNFLRVVSGNPAWTTVPNAEEASF